MVEGMSTALAASAKWAKTPNLLGDIVGCIQEESQVIENEEMLQVQSLEVDETKEGDASVRTAAFCTVYAWNNAVPELLRQSSPVIVIYTQSKMSHAASSGDPSLIYSAQRQC